MKKVLILYKFLPQYRIEFFNNLRDSLLKHDVELTLIYGKLKNQDSKKNDERSLEWAVYRDNKSFQIGSTSLLWQPCLDLLPKMDLVIVEQANSLIVNYFLMPLSKFMKFKFAFWGHGANLQDSPNSLKNKFKYFFLDKSDYWFAYTDGVAEFLISKGVEQEKISVVQNAIDTKSLKEQYDSLEEEEVQRIKLEMGIASDNVVIYCGGIYKEKRIDFLLKASETIRGVIGDFHIIFVGAGPDAYLVEEAANKNSWIHYMGPKFGKDRVPYFKMSELFLMPGLVGLAILDTFATQTPMVTTDFSYHSPEIEYLQQSVNGLVTVNTFENYTQDVIDLLQNRDKLESLKDGCRKASELYNTERMVDNFTNGVIECLKA